MANHVGKSQKWQEWQGREIISVNIDRGLAVRKRIGSGVVSACKQKAKELEQDLRPSHSSNNLRPTDCPTNKRKPKSRRLLPLDAQEETNKKESVKKKQGKKSNFIHIRNKRIDGLQPLPPINSSASSQISNSAKLKPSTRNMVARKATAATNLYDTRNVLCKENILFPDLVDFGLSKNASRLSTVLENPCKCHELNSIVEIRDNDSTEPLARDYLNENSFQKQKWTAKKKRLQSSALCYNCVNAVKDETSDVQANSVLVEDSAQHLLSPPIEAWRDVLPLSPVVFGRDAKPISNQSGSVAVLKFYRDNYPLLMNNFESTCDFPCMPMKGTSPEIVQRRSHRSLKNPTFKELDTTGDDDKTQENKVMRMRLDIKALRKILEKQRKKYSKQNNYS